MTFYYVLSLVLFALSAVLLYGFGIIFTFNFHHCCMLPIKI